MKKITAYQIAQDYQTSPLEYSDARQEIAAAVGCNPSDVILYAFDGYERTPKYKEVS